MYFIFALIALLAWSGSDLFSKTGTSQKDKHSHWKVIFAVGVIMGLHAVLSLVVSAFIPPLEDGADPEWWRTLIYTDFTPMDFVKYLPVAAIYLAAMVIGYAGLRYIELSVSSPICNSSGSLALLICVILGWAALELWTIIGVVLITLGIIMLGVVEYREDETVKLMRQDKSNFKYTKSLIAILIPVIYLVMDALGTVGDQMISELELFDMSEFASNTAFEFTAVLFAIIAFCWVKFVKKEKFFTFGEGANTKAIRRNLLIGGICETIGQMFYMAVMFSDFDAGMPMISAYCAASVLWSRIFLKEKLSWKHYLAILTVFVGIILLGIFSPV
ncbi:MAG: EamA family transporter [Clostridia bacterium]|nr:EamA family transporter [Clostridia bacterium]